MDRRGDRKEDSRMDRGRMEMQMDMMLTDAMQYLANEDQSKCSVDALFDHIPGWTVVALDFRVSLMLRRAEIRFSIPCSVYQVSYSSINLLESSSTPERTLIL